MSRSSNEYRAELRRFREHVPLPEGDLCPRCKLPMWPNPAKVGLGLDVGHVIDRALGGVGGPLRWEHARCGRRDGGRLGQALRPRRSVRSRVW